MKQVKDLTILVYDYGSYISVAQRLARDVKKVYYYCQWQTSFPKWNEYCVGMGVKNIERVDDIWDVFDEIDLFVFPDLFKGSFQDWLVSKGKIVFGSRSGEDMEIYRDEMKDIMKEVGLPVNKYERIEGFSKLSEYLKDKKDLYIKTNLIRGNGETFHYIDYKLSKSRLDELQHQLGAYKDMAIFIVETPIPDAVEIGYDGFFIDSRVPDKCLTGIEVKDAGYVGALVSYDSIAKVLKDINNKLQGVFTKAGYRGFYSNEVRYTKGKIGYLIDQTNRAGQPPSDLQQELFDNFTECIWHVANGILPNIKSQYKYGAQIIIKSSWATTEPQAIYFPKKYENYVKIKNLMYVDGVAHFVPVNVEMEEIGSVIGLGKTMDEAIEMAVKISKEVKGDCVSINGESLTQAKEQIKKAAEYGIKLM
jgi:predicted RNase H-like HicB family nuclease